MRYHFISNEALCLIPSQNIKDDVEILYRTEILRQLTDLPALYENTYQKYLILLSLSYYKDKEVAFEQYLLLIQYLISLSQSQDDCSELAGHCQQHYTFVDYSLFDCTPLVDEEPAIEILPKMIECELCAPVDSEDVEVVIKDDILSNVITPQLIDDYEILKDVEVIDITSPVSTVISESLRTDDVKCLETILKFCEFSISSHSISLSRVGRYLLTILQQCCVHVKFEIYKLLNNGFLRSIANLRSKYLMSLGPDNMVEVARVHGSGSYYDGLEVPKIKRRKL